MEQTDTMTLRRVANGWVIYPGGRENEFTHVATTPDDLAEHVRKWASFQIAPHIRPREL